MISALIMGSPVRRLINPITRCWDQPHNRYAGTDDGPGTGRKLDAKRLTLMRAQLSPAGALHQTGESDGDTTRRRRGRSPMVAAI